MENCTAQRNVANEARLAAQDRQTNYLAKLTNHVCTLQQQGAVRLSIRLDRLDIDPAAWNQPLTVFVWHMLFKPHMKPSHMLVLVIFVTLTETNTGLCNILRLRGRKRRQEYDTRYHGRLPSDATTEAKTFLDFPFVSGKH